MAIPKTVPAFRNELQSFYGSKGHSQVVKVKGHDVTVEGIFPHHWPLATLLFIFAYGLKQLIGDAPRSAADKESTKAKIIAAAEKAISKKLAAAELGELSSAVPLEVSETIALIKRAGFKVDAKVVRSEQSLRKAFAGFKTKASFETVWTAGCKNATILRAAREATKNVDPFAELIDAE